MEAKRPQLLCAADYMVYGPAGSRPDNPETLSVCPKCHKTTYLYRVPETAPKQEPEPVVEKPDDQPADESPVWSLRMCSVCRSTYSNVGVVGHTTGSGGCELCGRDTNGLVEIFSPIAEVLRRKYAPKPEEKKLFDGLPLPTWKFAVEAAADKLSVVYEKVDKLNSSFNYLFGDMNKSSSQAIVDLTLADGRLFEVIADLKRLANKIAAEGEKHETKPG